MSLYLSDKDLINKHIIKVYYNMQKSHHLQQLFPQKSNVVYSSICMRDIVLFFSFGGGGWVVIGIHVVLGGFELVKQQKPKQNKK